MLSLHTVIKDNNKKLDQNTVLRLMDACEYELLDSIVAQYGEPRYIINDACLKFHDRKIYALPLSAIAQSELLEESVQDNSFQTVGCFNFMINKKLKNRNILLKLIEYFNLASTTYTWSGLERNFDMQETIAELNWLHSQGRSLNLSAEEYSAFFNELLSPCRLQDRFIKNPRQINEQFRMFNPEGVSWAWNHGLRDMFQNSAVSLITETVIDQKAAVVTEKTTFAFLSQTLPIWVGGYGHADAWARAGFDVFSDIIDHSYQYKETLIERCFHAVADNLKLLNDLEYVLNIREKCRGRLLENKQKMLNRTALIDYCWAEIQQWPEDLVPVAMNFFDGFLKSPNKKTWR